MKGCNQCEAVMINGVFCHETGCINSKWRPRPKRKRFYVRLSENGMREVFSTALTPTREVYPDVFAVIGPFRTKAGAEFMCRYGAYNPHCQNVADAERLAKHN